MKNSRVTLTIVLSSAIKVATAEDTYCCNDRLDLDEKLALFFEEGNTPSSAPVGRWDVSKVHDSKYIGSINLMLPFRYLHTSRLLYFSINFHFLPVSGVFAGVPTFNEPLDGWDVSSVTDSTYKLEFESRPLFKPCFSGPLFSNIDVSAARNQ